MEEIASNLRVAGTKLDNLGRAYEQLQSQASSFLLFSLRWKDLQEYFDSLSKMIGDRLESLNVREKEVALKENQLCVIQKCLDECSQLVHEKEERLRLVQKSLDECNEEVDSQGKKLEEINRLSQQASNNFELKEKHLASLDVLIQDHIEELEKKEKDWNAMQKSIAESSGQLEARLKELASVQNSLGEHTVKVKAKEKRLLLMEEDIEERSKELEKKEKDLSHVQRQMRLWCQDIELKEREYRAIERSIGERSKELHVGGEELKSIQKLISDCEKQLRSKEEERDRDLKMITDLIVEREEVLKSIQRNIGECNRDLGKREEQLISLKELIKGREGELSSIQKKITRCDEELKTKEKALDSIQKSIYELAREIESKGKDYDDMVAKEEELKSLHKRIDHQVGELDKNKKDLDFIKLKTKERFMELEMKQKQWEERVKNLESKESQFNGRVKELQLKEKQFEERVKEIESKEKQVELLRKSFEDEKTLIQKGNIFLPRVNTEEQDFVDANSVKNSRNLQALFNELLKNYELVCREVSHSLQASVDSAKLVLDSMHGFYPSNSSQEDVEYDANIIRRSCILLLDELKKSSPVISSAVKEESMKLASEWKENLSVGNKDSLEVLGFLKLVATYELGSFFESTELHMLLDIISRHCQTSELRQSLGIIKTVPDNHFGAGPDGRNLHLTVNQQANANGLMGSDILVDPQTLDPAKLVLNIIRKPIIPQSTKEEKGAIIAGSHTFLLKWLMRMSPDITPPVREEAKKLAHELKAEMRASAENSQEVLEFLLLLSIYDIVSSFDEDEILKLFEIAAHHEQAVELFRTLGFATKISDFVRNLIKRQKPAEAVRFICAYELADKIPPVDLLREYVQNAKMVSKRRSKKSSFETKDKARDEELVCLRTVLKCISDNNLECQNLVKEIHNRIDELRRLKENRFGAAPGPSSKVEVQQPEKMKRINDGSTKKHQGQHCNNNNKRPRTAIRPSIAPVTSPIYHQPMVWLRPEGVILPDGMPAPLGPPTNDFGVGTPMGAGQYGNRGRNYPCHS